MDSTIGAIEIGTVLSGVLFGLITSQTYVYYKTYPKDSRFTKYLVGVMWLVELAHTACIFDALYMYTVRNYGDPTSLIKFPVSLDITIIMHGGTVITVQLFFTHRATSFLSSKVKILINTLAAIVLTARFAAFIVTGVSAVQMTDLPSFLARWKSLILVDLVSCAITDVFMSGILVYQLWSRREDATWRSTIELMDKLIMWTVETCLVTTFTTMVMLICFLTMQNNCTHHPFTPFLPSPNAKPVVWIGILLVQPKIFSNALLANLNSREGLRASAGDVHEMTNSARFRVPGSGTASGVTVSREIYHDKLYTPTSAVDSNFGTDSQLMMSPTTPTTPGSIYSPTVSRQAHTVVLDSQSETTFNDVSVPIFARLDEVLT
ncbi:hypothetical protein FB45DRAFT_1082511 [Roridomyces roridus]|uniref:DUF6534 domain-containing protein n=1 Tax=Roridomyces roridus TaxID=1738132 RepID=A0AAD7BQ40_9AGAR|nr:hypothetical protein FB45DRAFT_1082511 [Roridomyces roridus]